MTRDPALEEEHFTDPADRQQEFLIVYARNARWKYRIFVMIEINVSSLGGTDPRFWEGKTGYALRCYHCENSPSLCKTNSTCLATEDTCLQMKFGKLRTSSCWKASQCSMNDIAEFFQLDNFDFFCCQHDLCNESAIPGLNKAAFSIASVLTMFWMLL
ncbi:CD59 glycoprotein [Amazona aestiva]|uniref:CD59 glycoprotein n=1 Tax=Amazona aestiva TaxID=12930 RepID=A0A0Q3LTE3_AMAAE|nr:CD59 glycoprotein [Amazona aestiva]